VGNADIVHPRGAPSEINEDFLFGLSMPVEELPEVQTEAARRAFPSKVHQPSALAAYLVLATLF
jgi:hypothetical protein